MSTSAASGGAAPRMEAYVRRAWRDGPGPFLKLAGSAFGLGLAVRHRFYDAGLLGVRRPPLPVVSVGGVTVGGAGKTPVAAQVVEWLLEAGLRVGVATHGFPDEIDVHRHLNPKATVLGDTDRYAVVVSLAEDGCQVVVVDDGFQRRKLGRDFDLVVVDAETLGAGPVRYLPAGPYRERLSQLRRADAIVVTRRVATEGTAEEVAGRMRRDHPQAAVLRCALRPGPLVAMNERAREAAAPVPAVAVAAVMKADLALGQMRDRHPSIEHLYPLPDHAELDPRLSAELRERAGADGVVGTLKDAAKLVRAVGELTPVWYMADELMWETDPSPLRDRLRRVAPGAGGAPLDPQVSAG